MSDDSISDLDLGATVRGLTAGQHVFGRYLLQKILGRGGMGIVWLARDEKLARDVALKFLPDLVLHDRLALEQLKHETNRSLELTHPHIVRVYDFVQEGNDAAAIAMEFVDGDNLSDLRVERANHCFEVAELKPVVAQLCEALVYAHERAKIAHRDLKPANLMLTKKGELKVADFGIASTLSESVSRVSLRQTAGTLVYMSPQQLDGQPASALDDIYAVGATLYDLLTGKPPFYLGNLDRQIREKIPATIAARRAELGVTGGAEVPQVWEKLIDDCLAKSPADRPQSAREVAQRLGFPGFGSEQDLPKRSPVSAVPAKRLSRVPLLVGSIAAALILAALAGWWFLREQPRRQQASEQNAGDVEKLLVAGRYAMSQRQWPEARDAYAKAFQLRPNNTEARETLTKIDEHLAQARGRLDVSTDPPGATVYVLSKDNKPRKEVGPTPLKNSELPLGKVQLVFEKEGYEPAQKDAEIIEEKTADLGLIELKRSTGTLQIVTKPEGGEWELQAPNFPAQKGVAPATLKDLPTGDYQVHLRRPSWPEAVRVAKVERNAVASVDWEFAQGRLNVASEPSGAEIFQRISGEQNKELKSLGKTPLTVDLPTGRQELIAHYKDWPQQNKVVDVTTTAQAHADFKFLAGSITIKSQPSGALVKQGKKELGKTPLTLKELVPQNYSYTISLKGYKDRMLEAKVEPQKTCEASTNLEKDPLASLNEGERMLLGTWRASAVYGGQGSITFSMSADGHLQASQFAYRGRVPMSVGIVARGSTFNHSGTVSAVTGVKKGGPDGPNGWEGTLRGSFRWEYNPSSEARAAYAKGGNTVPNGAGTTSEAYFAFVKGGLTMRPGGSDPPFVFFLGYPRFTK